MLPDVLALIERPGRVHTVRDPVALAAVLPGGDGEGLATLISLSRDASPRCGTTRRSAWPPWTRTTDEIRTALADRLTDCRPDDGRRGDPGAGDPGRRPGGPGREPGAVGERRRVRPGSGAGGGGDAGAGSLGAGSQGPDSACGREQVGRQGRIAFGLPGVTGSPPAEQEAVVGRVGPDREVDLAGPRTRKKGFPASAGGASRLPRRRSG